MRASIFTVSRSRAILFGGSVRPCIRSRTRYIDDLMSVQDYNDPTRFTEAESAELTTLRQKAERLQRELQATQHQMDAVIDGARARRAEFKRQAAEQGLHETMIPVLALPAWFRQETSVEEYNEFVELDGKLRDALMVRDATLREYAARHARTCVDTGEIDKGGCDASE